MTTARATIPAEFNAFLAEPRNGILCVARGEGRPPHATPVWFLYEDGTFHISITRTRLKYRLIERRPSISLVVDDPSGFRTVIAEGTAEFSDTDEDLLRVARALRSKHRAGQPQPPDDELLSGLRAEQRVVVTLVPAHVMCIDSGHVRSAGCGG